MAALDLREVVAHRVDVERVLPRSRRPEVGAEVGPEGRDAAPEGRVRAAARVELDVFGEESGDGGRERLVDVAAAVGGDLNAVGRVGELHLVDGCSGERRG